MDITVTNYKGGVGKTTTAIHLAAILQEDGPTLLIDGDENRSASIWASAGKLPFQVARPNQSHKYVRECRHVVFDTKGRPEPQDMADLAEGCDLIVLPTSPKALDLDAVFTTVEVLQELKATYKVLLTLVRPQAKGAVQSARKTLEESGIPVFKAEIRNLAVFERTPLQGVLVKDMKEDKAKTAWQDYYAMKEELGL